MTTCCPRVRLFETCLSIVQGSCTELTVSTGVKEFTAQQCVEGGFINATLSDLGLNFLGFMLPSVPITMKCYTYLIRCEADAVTTCPQYDQRVQCAKQEAAEYCDSSVVQALASSQSSIDAFRGGLKCGTPCDAALASCAAIADGYVKNL